MRYNTGIVKVSILTLFPEIIHGYITSSIMAKACEQGILSVDVVDIRDFAKDRHKTCDDEPYGGGYGMLLKPDPLAAALDSVGGNHVHTIFPTPVASLFTQSHAVSLAQRQEFIVICGRYEGIDQRIIDVYVDEVYSVGDYILSSGEIAALVVLDAVYRLVEGVITPQSLDEESYTNGLLEYPQYTRPAEFQGHTVPEVLLSGNHQNIKAWRDEQRIINTKRYRPDLITNDRHKNNK